MGNKATHWMSTIHRAARTALPALWLLAALVPVAGGVSHQAMAQERALEVVTVQLKWRHQFQFAGYYAAIEKGYYRDAGLDVRLREPEAGEEPAQAVLDGKAEYGIATSDLLLFRARGEPVVALAAIFQHSALAFVSLNTSKVRSVHDLPGKRVMIEPHAADLQAYMHDEGVPMNKVEFVDHTFDPSSLISGQVDAMSVYVTDEPYLLEKAGRTYNVFSPRASGIDFYGDTLFTTEQELAKHPKRAQAFLDATLKGWAYALDHPGEIIDLILERYSQRHSREHLTFEARKMIPLINHKLVAIGHMNPGRWRYIAERYMEFGLIHKDADLDDFIYEMSMSMTSVPAWVLPTVAAALALSLLLGSTAYRTHSLNVRLGAEITERERLQEELKRHASTDFLTGIFNRRRFQENLEDELARTQRTGVPSTLLILDLDHFKSINDDFGHPGGDEAIRKFAEITGGLLRRIDVFARLGGEEFGILLRDTPLEGALLTAERIRKTISAQPVAWEGQEISLTVSIGVTQLLEHDDVPSAQARADEALYRAKNAGRNRTEMA